MSLSSDKEDKLTSNAEHLEQEARGLFKAGNLKASLRTLQRAYQLSPSDRLKRKIDRLGNLLNPEGHSDIDHLIERTTNLSIHADAQESNDKQVVITRFSRYCRLPKYCYLRPESCLKKEIRRNP